MVQHDRFARERICEYCRGAIPETRREGARFCRKKCCDLASFKRCGKKYGPGDPKKALARARRGQVKKREKRAAEVHPFRCERCRMSYPTSNGLRQHESKAHGLRSERFERRGRHISRVRPTESVSMPEIGRLIVRGGNMDSAGALELWALSRRKAA